MLDKKKLRKTRRVTLKSIRAKYKLSKYGLSIIINRFGFTAKDMMDLFKWDIMLQACFKHFYDYNPLNKTYSLKPEFVTSVKLNLLSVRKEFSISKFKLDRLIKSKKVDLGDADLRNNLAQILNKKKNEFSIVSACKRYGLSRYQVVRILKKYKINKPYTLSLAEFEKHILYAFGVQPKI